jgi:hypothetical protein
MTKAGISITVAPPSTWRRSLKLLDCPAALVIKIVLPDKGKLAAHFVAGLTDEFIIFSPVLIVNC